MIKPPAERLTTIHSELRRRIDVGEWKLGEKIPTTGELAQTFGCSVNMMSKAITMLVQEGLVEQRTKVGTRVIKTSRDAAGAEARLDAYAFICPSEQHDAIWRMFKGFQLSAQQVRRRIVMLSTESDYQKETEIIERLSEFDVAGAVISPMFPTFKEQAQLSEMVDKSKFPIVMLGVDLPGLSCPMVGSDGFHLGYTMARHMLDQGLKRIGFFANHARSQSARERHMGYSWALQEAGVAEDHRLVMLDPEMHPNFGDPLREPQLQSQAYLEAAHEVEGVVCAHDHLAYGLIEAAQHLGKLVPQDLRVSGAGNYVISGKPSDFLTTYEINYEAMGSKAFELLDEVLSGKKPRPMEVRMQGHIVVRQSA